MKSLAVVLLLTAHALAEPQVHVLRGAEDTKELRAPLEADKAIHPWPCESGFRTNVIMSWRCNDDDAGVHRTFSVVAGKPVPFDLAAEVRSKDAFADAMKHGCTNAGDPYKTGVFIGPQGIEIYKTADAPHGCVLEWRTFYSALRPQGALATAARTAGYDIEWESAYEEILDPNRAVQLPTAARGKTPAKRFVAEGDYGVRDTQTNLVWAARQDKNDVDAEDAAELAHTYRGGGHTDWRLPRIGELAALSTGDLAHPEPGDCTAGKNKYTITPLIHLTCGLAWSTTKRGNQTAAWGFGTGSARLADPDNTTGYRALLVRGPD